MHVTRFPTEFTHFALYRCIMMIQYDAYTPRYISSVMFNALTIVCME